MQQADFTLESPDGHKIFGHTWLPEDKGSIKGVVQIAHGMAEHAGRYAVLAKFLTQNGYAVYANDHRGHRHSATDEDQKGFFAMENGWRKVVDDMAQLTDKIKADYPAKDVFLLGHSLGSMLSRYYLLYYGEKLQGMLISGTAKAPGLMGPLGMLLARLEGKMRSKKAKSYLLNLLSFGSFNAKFKPTRTMFDWLSRSHEEVDKYVNDPDCGGVFTAGYFQDLLYGIMTINSKKYFHAIPKKVPLYFFSGDMDPVGGFGKGTEDVVNAYIKAGCEDVSFKFYEGGRHEMLNEINRSEVFDDLLGFIRSHASKA